MKKLFYAVLIVGIGIIGYSISGGESDDDFAASIELARQNQINFLQNSSQSPFHQFNIPFEKPEFFPASSEYRVRATLQRIETTQRVIIENSDGTSEVYVRFAIAKFKLKGLATELLILKPVGFGALNKYFTAFADETSGNTTYGGGRYLDLEIGKSDNIIIDFNLAYNPYCAYAHQYSCPLPPQENILALSVEAGERDYKH